MIMFLFFPYAPSPCLPPHTPSVPLPPPPPLTKHTEFVSIHAVLERRRAAGRGADIPSLPIFHTAITATNYLINRAPAILTVPAHLFRFRRAILACLAACGAGVAAYSFLPSLVVCGVAFVAGLASYCFLRL
jgi:hypothetical protein